DLSDDIIHSPISLLDNSYAFIAFSRKKSQEAGLVSAYVNEMGKMYVDDIDSLSASLAGLDADASRPDEILELRNDQNVLVFSANVYNEKNDHMATLMTAVFDEEDYLINYSRTILGLMRSYVSDLYSSNGSLYHADQTPNKSHMVLRDTLSGVIVPISEWQDTMAVKGWRNEDRLQFVIFKSDLRYDPKSFSQYLCPEIEALWRCCICIEFENDIVLLFNLTLFEKESSESPRNEIVYFQRENLLKSGISREFIGYAGINAAYRQAIFAISYGDRIHPSIWSHEFDTYAYNYLLLHGQGSFNPQQVCAPEILQLKEHDKRHETSYYQTLHAYFECGFNASSAARALYIHRSTFLDRMTRIYEITRLTPAALENLNVRNYLGISFSICDNADSGAESEN
ncbi:MAG: PucR family transcriptional regulator, partial [Lachnospiraceae bacterium]